MPWDGGSLFGRAMAPVGPFGAAQPPQPSPQQLAGLVGNTVSTPGQAPGFFNFGPNQGINLGDLGAGALQAATMLPKAGTLASIAQLLMRGYNTANADAVNKSIGAGGLNLGQILGSLLGLNNYGSLGGNQTFANNEGAYRNPITGNPVAVTAGGMYDQGFLGGGPFGMFSDWRSAYTPQEANLHNQLAKTAAVQALVNNGTQLNGGGGGNAGGANSANSGMAGYGGGVSVGAGSPSGGGSYTGGGGYAAY